MKKQKNENINFYDNNSENYFKDTINLKIDKSIFETFLKKIPKNGYILDRGCGSARDSIYLQSKGYNVESFDASKNLVKLAKKNGYKNIKVETFDSFKTNKKYDGILFMASLVHADKKEFENTIKKFKQFLKPNSTIYFSLKEGEGEFKNINGRDFYYWKPIEIFNILKNLKIKGSFFKTEDSKKVKQNEKWLNFFVENDEPKLNLGLEMS